MRAGRKPCCCKCAYWKPTGYPPRWLLDELFTQLKRGAYSALAAKITLTLRPSLVVVADRELLAQALSKCHTSSISPENGVITLSAQLMGEKAILQVTDSAVVFSTFATHFRPILSRPSVENGRKKQRAWAGVCQRGGAAPHPVR